MGLTYSPRHPMWSQPCWAPLGKRNSYPGEFFPPRHGVVICSVCRRHKHGGYACKSGENFANQVSLRLSSLLLPWGERGGGNFDMFAGRGREDLNDILHPSLVHWQKLRRLINTTIRVFSSAASLVSPIDICQN